MKCSEIKRILDNKYQQSDASNTANDIDDIDQDKLDKNEVTTHAERCEDCRQELAMQRLTSALLQAYTSTEREPGEHPDLMGRIRARIRELSEQGVGSWEAAILALRGWIFAFGAVAILLLTVSFQSKYTSAKFSSAPRIDPVEDASSLIPVGEDFISSIR